MRRDLLKFTIRRLAGTIPTLIIVTAFVYSLVHLMPGSPATVMLPPRLRTERNIQILIEQYNLNEPIWKQYLHWMAGFATGDMGESFLFRRPVADLVVEGSKRTFALGFLAWFIGIVIAIPFGVLSAVYRNSWVDNLSRFNSIAGISIPEFWLALVMILFFTQYWASWFGSPLIPPSGYSPINNGIIEWFRHLVGPATVLAIPYAAVIIRITRSSMVDVLNKEYITNARAKGVREKSVIGLHALRNASIPIVTVGAYQMGSILNGSVLVETVFTFPGLGWMIFRAANNQDYPLLMGLTVVVLFIYISINFAADILYKWIDPRIEYGGSAQ